MNKVILVAAAMMMASPAFAQSYDPDVGSGNITPHATATVFQGAQGAYARVLPGTSRGRAVIAPATTAVHDEYGHVIGADPDPSIRLQLRRGADSIEW
jgi:hypothetical protein